MKIKIKRERYVIVLDNKEIFCGLARCYTFKDYNNIGDTPIKTYVSEKKARAAFLNSWRDAYELLDANRIKFIKVNESIEEV